MITARLPESLVADLRKIEREEQSDISTVVRKLLHKAVSEWKKEHEGFEGSTGLGRGASGMR